MNIKKKIYPGYIDGFKYPVALIEIDDVYPNQAQVEILKNLINGILPPNLNQKLTPNLSIIELVQLIIDSVLDLLNCGIVEKSRIEKLANRKVRILIPCHLSIANKLISFLEICIMFSTSNTYLNNLSNSTDSIKSQLISFLTNPFKNSNSSRFVKAAYKLNCPINVYDNDFIEYGVGHYKIRMRSSLTKSTNSVACAIARDKKLTSDLLCQALFPGSGAIRISDFANAAEIAKKIGFPVVLKPRLLDGGVGVYPNLQNETQLKSAFIELQKITDQVLIEKYVIGKDYRLVCYKGSLIWAIERIYPGVSCDGIHSIHQLVDIENLNPLRNRIYSKVLTTLNLDHEALECIKKQGYSPESIPGSGTFVRLRDKSNINAGGFPEIFPINQIHPDNAQLAHDVTKLIDLDLAGIDLIITDLSKSWRHSNALICEINAQPTLGELTTSHLYEKILRAEMPSGWNIPVVLLSTTCSSKTFDKIKSILNVQLENLGIVKEGVAYLDNKQLNQQPISCYDAAKGLLQRDQLKALILTADISLTQTGLPHFEIEFLCIPDEYLYISKEKQIEIRAIIFMTVIYCKKLLISRNVKNKAGNLINQIEELVPNVQIQEI